MVEAMSGNVKWSGLIGSRCTGELSPSRAAPEVQFADTCGLWICILNVEEFLGWLRKSALNLFMNYAWYRLVGAFCGEPF